MRYFLIALIGSSGCSLLFDQPGALDAVADAGPCPGGVIDQPGDKSYFVAKCSSSKGLQQREAQAQCQALGGSLAVIETPTEHQFLLDVVADDGDLWIGLRYDVGSGFSWEGAAAPVTLFCDADGCSSTLPSLDETRCFVMDFGLNGAWQDTDCELTDDYLCEVPM